MGRSPEVIIEMGSSTAWCVLSSFFLILSSKIYLCKHCSTLYFAVSKCSKLESQYCDWIRAALAFVREIEDFDDLVNAHHLFDCCLGLEPTKYVLEKIYQEEKSMYILVIFLMLYSSFL